MIISTEAGGKTKRVTASGVSETKNDIILCSFVEANRMRRRQRRSKITRTCRSRNPQSK